MATKRPSTISTTLKSTLYFFIIALTSIGCANSARILVADATSPLPNVVVPTAIPLAAPPTVAPVSSITPVTATAPAFAPIATLPAPADSTTAATPAVAIPPVSSSVVTTPVANLAPVVGPTTTQQGGPTTANPALSFFMHDILGGSQPSGRVVAGIVANMGVNSQLPFSRPNTAVLPINGGIPLLNNGNNINGVLNNNNIPYLAGLGGGASSTTVIANSGNNNAVNGGNKLPFVDAGQLPTGATLQELMFGTITVVDDELTDGQDLGSSVVGKAQGFYLASSVDGTSHTMALTALFHGGAQAPDDTISFFGVHRTVATESQVAVVGGTGKYENAKGYANIQTLQSSNDHTTDGVETLHQFSVYLSY
ncbi:dirigent protein 9-like [Telopea speciosissima]|uniref:dirigent protein 9-like n=1 Tax=Telopea speciosissima TaxID=54955 RepID=UPI001CC5960D|nr:dirigent protein 9-like [Telopea speciosissima]